MNIESTGAEKQDGIRSVFSAGKAPEAPEQLQELIKNIIIMTNYVPGIRSSLGWRGIFRIPCEYETWTFKISGFDGVFGLMYSNSDEIEGCYISDFDIFYFPDPGEDLIDKFSLNGALLAYKENYTQMIRQFPEYPDFADYFYIGNIYIKFNPENFSITTGIDALSENVIVSVNGIMAGESTEEYIVYPGDPEQAIPSYMLCSAVFDILVSSLSYLTGKGPSALKLGYYEGYKGFFMDGSLRHEKTGDDITLNSLSALFTDCPDNISKFVAPQNIFEMNKTVIWTCGMPEIPEEFPVLKCFNQGTDLSSHSLNRSLLGIEIKPPLYVVSGFLGAGKTTFIKNFLEFQSQKYLFGAVIQNELGEEGLDGKLISDECRVVEMDEGCVCCSLSGSLRKGINSIISEFVPDFILLETTGAANPMNLISEIHDLRDIVKFDSVTTVIDSVNIIDTVLDYEIARDQIKAADIIILNKTDCAGSEQVEEIKKTISSINRRAVIAQSEFGRINPSLLYDTDVNFSGNNHAMKFTLHEHGNHSLDGISDVTLSLPVQINRNQFLEKVSRIPFDIFRMKGLIRFMDSEETFLFQYVSGRYEISEYGANEIMPFVVLIGRDADRPEVTDYFRF